MRRVRTKILDGYTSHRDKEKYILNLEITKLGSLLKQTILELLATRDLMIL